MNKFIKNILLGIYISIIVQTALSTDAIEHESTLSPIVENSQENGSEISQINVTEVNEDSPLNISKTSNEHVSEIKKDSHLNNSEVHTERDHTSQQSSSNQTHHLDINHTEHTNDLSQTMKDHKSKSRG